MFNSGIDPQICDRIKHLSRTTSKIKIKQLEKNMSNIKRTQERWNYRRLNLEKVHKMVEFAVKDSQGCQHHR